MKLKTILIDDERKAIDILKNKIAKNCNELEIVGSFQNPIQAIDAVKKLSPDLVFLDVSMPEMDGFEFLESIKEQNIEVIFATAFDEYALKALKQCAMGYLVKPVDNEELVAAVNNAKNHIKNKLTSIRNRALLANQETSAIQNERIAIPTENSFEFFSFSEIIHFEGDSGYTNIHFTNHKKILSSRSVGYFFKLVESELFYQVHRSHIINISHVKKYYNDGYVELSNGNKVPVSRSRRSDFIKIF